MYMFKQIPESDIPDGNTGLHVVMSAYIGITLCCLGFLGNLISILVWKRINRQRHDSSKSAGMFLIALAFVDTGLLIFFAATEGFQNIATDAQNSYAYVWFFCYIGFPVYFFFILASVWLVVSITYNRFIAVVLPHRAASMNTVRKSYVIIFTTIILAFLTNIPHFFNYRPVRNVQNTWDVVETEYGKSFSAVMYDFWGHCIVLVLVPWLLILVLNLLIIRKLYQRRPVKTKGKSSKEHQTTVILLTISFSFLLCLMWQCLVQCFYMLQFKSNNKDAWYHISTAYDPARVALVLNSSINFILYCLSGQMFRKEMYTMFAEWFRCDNYRQFLDSSTTISRTNTVSRSGYSTSSAADLKSTSHGGVEDSTKEYRDEEAINSRDDERHSSTKGENYTV